jgi:H/ACA ribonucleoprotein complex subunit 3
MTDLFYCKKCKIYTLNKICKNCNQNTILKNPPRFSPQDRYGKYRRELKRKINEDC